MDLFSLILIGSRNSNKMHNTTKQQAPLFFFSFLFFFPLYFFMAVMIEASGGL